MANQHLYEIKRRLTATFNIRKFVLGGSFARNTFIRGGSDVDLFALISRKDFTWGGELVGSKTALEQIRDSLLARYPNTSVYRDAQAVVVRYAQGASVDVVPTVFERMLHNNWPLYHIPDGEGGWMPACPELHNKYIAEGNLKSGQKLIRVARLVKYWRECRSITTPLSSFHIEMILASNGVCSGVKSYPACIAQTFQLLAERECRALQDPLSISGHIPAVKTAVQLESVIASVKHSRDHAKDACVADYAGDVTEALRQWDIVFNYSFPKS